MRLFKSGQADAYTAGYSSSMSIVRDDRGEHPVRVDRMIEEFRQAQSRRRATGTAVKADEQVVESQRDARRQAAVVGSTTKPASHEND